MFEKWWGWSIIIIIKKYRRGTVLSFQRAKPSKNTLVSKILSEEIDKTLSTV